MLWAFSQVPQSPNRFVRLDEYIVRFGREFNWPGDVIRRQRMGDLNVFITLKEDDGAS